jgi:hypothetical protein
MAPRTLAELQPLQPNWFVRPLRIPRPPSLLRMEPRSSPRLYPHAERVNSNSMGNASPNPTAREGTCAKHCEFEILTQPLRSRIHEAAERIHFSFLKVNA